MISAAVEQAEERLKRAKIALQTVTTGGDRKDRESAWIDLISALATVYSKLEQGAKSSAKSAAWFGSKKHMRRTDQLLAYIHHARNSAEHGISPPATFVRQAVSFHGVMKPGTMAGLHLTNEGMRPISNDPDLKLRFVENDVRLLTVKDRDVVYHPPTEHLGQALTAFGASQIGSLAVSYVEQMVKEARTLIV